MHKASAVFLSYLAVLCMLCGATTSRAQAPENPVVGITVSSSVVLVATAGGDVYAWNGANWAHWPNVFGGDPPPGGEVVGITMSASVVLVATANGDVHAWNGADWERWPNAFGGGPAPGNEVVDITMSASVVLLVTANGDVYAWGGADWEHWPNVFETPTSAQAATMGQLKAKYATPRGDK